MPAKRKYEMTIKHVLEDWASKIPEVMTWLAKLQRKAERARFLWLYCDWAKKTPVELLALKDDSSSKEAEYLLDRFVAESELTDSMKWCSVNAARSFYRSHYKDLAKEAGKMYLPRKKPLRKLSKEDILKISRACMNPRDRAIVSFTASSAVARDTLINLKWSHLEDDWEQKQLPHVSVEDKFLKGHGVGRYKGVRQETFLTPEAKRDLIDYKEWLERRMGKKLTKDMNIFIHIEKPYGPLRYEDMSRIAIDLKRRSGVEFGWHDFRRHVETALETIKINPNWARKIRGRKVRGEEAPYSLPAITALREKYREALPHLIFIEKPEVSDEQRILEQLRFQIASLSISEQKKKELLSVARSTRFKGSVEAGEWLRKQLRKRETATNGGCQNGNCQRIVSEEELPNLLAQGWRVSAVLPSGKIVVGKR